MAGSRKMTEASTFLDEQGASVELRQFGESVQSLRQFWDQCPRADWMLWVLDRTEQRNRRELRSFACWCARRFLHLMRDPRCKRAVETAELFASGHASKADLRRAGDGAADTADEASKTSQEKTWLAKLAWATTQESSIASATQASLYAAMLARCTASGPLRSAWLDAMHRQAEKLRELVANPFIATGSDAA
jgi:hypothetical protein